MSSHSRAARRARLVAAAVAALALAPALAACSALGGSSSSTTPPATQSPGAAGATTPAAGGTSSTAGTSGNEPSIVAAMTNGAIERLNPATGAVLQTLVPAGNGVEPDELSVASSGTVYYASGSGACDRTVYSIPDGGGTPTPIVAGSLPAISPDGTKLAYAVEPGLAQDCSGVNSSDPGTAFHVDIRTLSSGTTVSIPELPPTQVGLPAWVTHLSWAPDNDHLAVSVEGVQDNEGWALDVLDTSTARTYLPGAGVTTVPVTGASPDGQSYWSEGAYMPNGDLFVVHSCCAGIPAKTDAQLMWEVQPDGAMVRQVAIGFVNTTHNSLDVSPDGNWLMYLGGGDLFVSQGGARPSQVGTGLVAAAWA